MRIPLRVVGVILTVLITTGTAQAGTITYASLVTFQAATGTTVLDTYDAPGYASGDVEDGLTQDIHSNTQMSAILGETDYFTTGYDDWNIVWNEPTDPTYCAGCNGSFRLTFTSTSVGTSSGVYGVGLDARNFGSPAYIATVTFGDMSTTDYVTPVAGFFGITSDLLIRSIHFGLANGGATESGSFSLDDLRIAAAPGAAAVSESGALQTVALGTVVMLLGFALRRI